jgi:hypothetical protein
MDPRLGEVFRDKPELVEPPEWMLEPETTRRLAGARAGVVELAGRDSVAAAVRAAAEQGLEALLPTYAYTATEHGAWAWVETALGRLAARLPAGVELMPLVVLGWPELWRALCGRFLGRLVRRYGFSPVCVGCHLYLHAVRAPLARRLGAAIISGERESHDGRVKLNQLGPALDAYAGLCAELGAELWLPVRGVADGGEIASLAGEDWPEGGEQLFCALSGNYQEPAGGVDPDPAPVEAYLREFALPLARRAVAARLAGRQADPLAEGARLLTV